MSSIHLPHKARQLEKSLPCCVFRPPLRVQTTRWTTLPSKPPAHHLSAPAQARKSDPALVSDPPEAADHGRLIA